MNIPMLDLSRLHAPLEQELKAVFDQHLQSNRYIMGSSVTEFETACAEYLEVKHAIGVSSGSDALLLSLMTLGIKPGDEVICPTYTFFATAGAVARLGATPIFVDCEPGTFNWKLEEVFQAYTPRTRAVIPVHLFGQAARMEGLMEWARDHQVHVIEDVAQATGSTWKKQKLGSVGHMGCFSFFPSKNLGGFGDGGLITTHDDALAEQARVLRSHGSKPKYYHRFVGGNFRLDALQAALLHVKLPHLDRWNASRQETANYYLERLKNLDIRALPRVEQHNTMTWNQFMLTFHTQQHRDAAREYLASHNIASMIYYPLPLHQQPCFDVTVSLPVAEAASQQTLAIPIYPEIRAEERDQVASAIENFVSDL